MVSVHYAQEGHSYISKVAGVSGGEARGEAVYAVGSGWPWLDVHSSLSRHYRCILAEPTLKLRLAASELLLYNSNMVLHAEQLYRDKEPFLKLGTSLPSRSCILRAARSLFRLT